MTKCRNCDRTAVYNHRGLKGARYCGGHKTDDMIDVVSRRCIAKDCETIANFNYPGEKKAYIAGVMLQMI